MSPPRDCPTEARAVLVQQLSPLVREGAHELSYLVLWQAVPVRDGGGRGEAKVRAVGVPAPVCDFFCLE